MRLRLNVNGQNHELDVEARRTLADVLRDDLGLHGTHLGCEHGVCGACTVLVDGAPVRSCLVFAVSCEGARITTVEGLARDGELHPVQQAFVDNGAMQCGFCTPGFVVLAAGALAADPDMGDDDILELVSANLCRCTGYEPIVAAVRAAAERMRAAR